MKRKVFGPLYVKSEREIQLDIVAYLKTLNIQHTITDSGVNARLRRRKMRKSWPDITALLPGGRMWCIEVKTPKGKYQEGQEDQLKDLTYCGAMVTVARSLQDAIDAYEGRQNHEPQPRRSP